jgi:hypothetical protein
MAGPSIPPWWIGGPPAKEVSFGVELESEIFTRRWLERK